MMNHDGWMGGGMWIWTVIGILVVVLLVVVRLQAQNVIRPEERQESPVRGPERSPRAFRAFQGARR
jgi:uncharacterized membrane protein